MQSSIILSVHDSRELSDFGKCLTTEGNRTQFRAPKKMIEKGFPIQEGNFDTDTVLTNPSSKSIYKECLSGVASDFLKKRQNAVIFSYGIRSTPKRQLMYGSKTDEGYVTKTLCDVVNSSSVQGQLVLSAYVIGHSEKLIDLINIGNDEGVIVESVKEGPKARMTERIKVKSAEDVKTAMTRIVQNYEYVFSAVLPEKQSSPELEALPPYNGDSIILQLCRYETEEDYQDFRDANSLTFVSLGDAEKPIYCGVNASQQAIFDKTQRVLLSAVGIVSAIKCNRLRIPFGKSKMTQLLKRSYNAERGFDLSAGNAPTKTLLFVHCFTDGKYTEETYHNLSMTRRITNTIGSAGIGSLLRDLTVEKWRLDQDTFDLREEIAIAKAVYDYKPKIYESSHPIADIKQQEEKYVSAIQTKREESRGKQVALLKERMKAEAARMIKEQEVNSGTTLVDLQKTLESKKADNAALQADRDNRTREYEQTLEKIRNKKKEEEQLATNLKRELKELEKELEERQSSVQSKQQQLEMIKLDKAKGRDAILKEQAGVQAARKNLLEERRNQRQQWIKQIRDINDKVLDQIDALGEERRLAGEQTSTKEEQAEAAIKDDIKYINEYLPKLISLEDSPVNPTETEAIRRQFDDVFAQEKQSYLKKIDDEKLRKEKLEKGLDAYRNRVLEVAQSKKKENLQDAMRKEHHLNTLIDQVLSYLRQGVKMTKISSKGYLRRRFYFISEDGKRIHSCELDNQGAPINRKKPPVTIWIKDIKKVGLGCYTNSFLNYAPEGLLSKARSEVVSDKGTFNPEVTHKISPNTLGLYNYRSFALLLSGGKSLEVVCDSDTDFEAWMVGLKRILNVKTPTEVSIDNKLNNNSSSSQCEIKYGGLLDIRQLNGFVSLSAEEGEICSQFHVPPSLFLHLKQELVDKSHTSPVTLYDVRVCSGLDLIRSAFLYDYFTQSQQVPFFL